MLCRLILAIPLVTLALASADDTPPREEMGVLWTKKWAENNKKFEAQLGQARMAVQKAFNSAIGNVNRQKVLTPAARVDRRKALQEAQQTFERYGTFPPDDQFTRIEF